MEIREPRPGDFRSLERLGREAWVEGFREILTDEEIRRSRERDSFDQDRFHEDLDAEDMIYLVAEEEGDVIGSIKIACSEDGTQDFVEEGAELRTVRVRPDHWREGVGTRLFQEAVSGLPATAERIKVEAFAGNDLSTGFYRSLGFRPVHKGVLDPEGVDSLVEEKEVVIMEKKL